MGNNITLNQLEDMVKDLEKLTGKRLVLDKNIGGVTINEKTGNAGGVRTFFRDRYTKNGLSDAIDLYTQGYRDALKGETEDGKVFQRK